MTDVDESLRVLGLLIEAVWPDDEEIGYPVPHPGLRSCQLALARVTAACRPAKVRINDTEEMMLR